MFKTLDEWRAYFLSPFRQDQFNTDVLDMIENMQRAIEALDPARNKAVIGNTDEELQKMADYNRDNAARLFGDVLWYDEGPIGSYHWYTVKDNKPVVFTPYGWQEEK